MDTVKEVLASAEFWKFVVPLLGAVIAWYTNEWRKRIADQYQRKEESYKELLRTLRGFYVGAENAQALRSEFLGQLNVCWLYCSDEVIRKGYAFLDTVHAKQVCTDAQKEAALGSFVAAVRADLLSRKLVRTTALTSEDFKHFGAR